MPSKFRSVIDLKLVLMCIFKRTECWNVAYSKRNIVSYDLFLSGKFRISCISRSDIRILAAKWSFRLWTKPAFNNQEAFPIICWVFCFFFMEWLGNNIFDMHFFLEEHHVVIPPEYFWWVSYIMKWCINQSFISAQIYLAWRSRWCVEEKSWHSLYSMHFHVRKGPEVLFCYCFGSNITLLIK